MKIPQKHISITLSVFHLPVLAALLIVAGLGAESLALNKGLSGNSKLVATVLSKETDREVEVENENENENDNKDENKTENDNKSNDDTEKQGKSDDQDNEIGPNNKINTTSINPTKVPETSDEDEKDEIKTENHTISSGSHPSDNEAEDELDASEERVEISSVNNDDGTVTKTYKITDGDEVETVIITYDSSGNVISKEKLDEEGKSDQEETVLVSETTNSDGSITKVFKRTDDGEIEMWSLTYDQDGKLIKRAKLNPDGSIIEEKIIGEENSDNPHTDDNEFEVTFRPGDGGTVDPALSNIIKAKLEQEIDSEEGLGPNVNNVELTIKTDQGTVKYEGTLLKDEKLFGLFDIQIPSDIEVDPITGKIIAVNQTFWAKILAFFSI